MESDGRPGAAPGRAGLDDLVRAVARHGDRAAFAELFRHFAPRVKAYLMRLGADPTLAEELTQETMITVWRRAEGFDSKRAGTEAILVLAGGVTCDSPTRR